jgi:hypothetical protein
VGVAVDTPPAVSGGPASLDGWVAAWPLVIEAVNRRDPMLAGVLRSCRPVEGTRDRVVVGAPYGFHLEKLQDRIKAPLLAEAVTAVAGGPCAVEAIFSGEPADGGGGRSRPGERADVPPVADPEAPDATSVVLSAFPGARLTGSVLRDSRSDLAP